MNTLQYGLFNFILLNVEYFCESEFAPYDSAFYHIKIIDLQTNEIKDATLADIEAIENIPMSPAGYVKWNRKEKLFFWKVKRILNNTWDFNYESKQQEEEN